ncbi:MAG: hypothetical protein EBU84_16610, partial [Actinobacteria bacterium]|nr:hypothetical protein [Actinomycetota bacterium]
NHSNISVQYSTGSNYIIETVKSDLYVRDSRTGISSNLTAEPIVLPSNITPVVQNIYKILNFVYYPIVDVANLLVHYKFDDYGSGEGYLDSSGNGYNLTARAGDTPVFSYNNSIVGSSAYENGSTGSGLVIPNTLGSLISSTNTTTGISISFWFSLALASNWADVLCFGFNNADYRGLIIGQPPSQNRFFIGMQNGTTFPYGYIGNANGGMFNSLWHHLVWTIDTQGNWKVYIDNILQTFADVNQGTNGVPKYTIPNYAYNNNTFFAGFQASHNNGYIDDFRMYKKVLSVAEISTLYNISSGAPNIYTLHFPVPTTTDILNKTAGRNILNNSNLILHGIYDLNLSPSVSQIVPRTGQYLPFTATSNLSQNIAFRYHLLNPIKMPEGAQWTYSSNNANVYHLGNVGIGTTNPSYNLDVSGNIFTSTGGYTQSGLTTWTVMSDRRIKENIVKASYDKCLENVKNIELYNFNFKDNCVNTNDRRQLGFIAQEVQQVYPKAVEAGKMTLNTNETIDNVLTLNTTQIKYTLYGAVKELINKVEMLETKINM